MNICIIRLSKFVLALWTRAIVRNPLFTTIYNGTTCVIRYYFFLQNGCMCVFKDIYVKQLLDKNLTSFIW